MTSRFAVRVQWLVWMLVGSILPGLALAACPAEDRGAAAVRQAVVALDVDRIAALIDTQTLAARVTEGMPEDDEFTRVLPAAFESARPQMARNLVTSIGIGGGKAVEQPGAGARALLRKQGRELGTGVDYIEFELGADGCVVDWTSLMQASQASRLMRQNMLLMRDDAGLLASLFGVSKVDTQQAAQLRALADAVRRGDHVAAVAALDGMKAMARNSFELTMLRVGMLAHDHTSAAYREALADVAERFGEDDRTQFMLVDHYYFIQDYAKALAAVERMQDRVGPDEENELLRGGLLKLMGRHDEAVIALRSMVALAPERPDTHGVLVANLAELGLHAEAVAAMRAAEARDITFSEATMRSEPAYAGLLASPEYAAYREARAED